MELNWLEVFIYGIVSGISEFLPVSAQAHQTILLTLFGCSDPNYLINFCVHIGMYAALIVTSGGYIKRMYKEYQLSRQNRRRRKRELNMQSVFDIRLVKIACVPVLASLIFYARTSQLAGKIPVVSLFMLLNGILLFIPMYMARGNKDSRHMSAFDGILFGIGSALSVFPGVSRVGGGYTIAVMRGADPQQAYKWTLILSVPVLFVLTCFDLYFIFAVGIAQIDFLFILKCLLSGIGAYFSATVAIILLKSLTNRTGLAAFSYYSWGAALFAFILYLY